MKRALAAAAVLASFAAAAPAAASPAVFAMDAPASALHPSASGGVRSSALRPPRPFDLVGLSWRGRLAPRVEVRARVAGRRWTAWRRLGADSGDGPDAGSREAARRAFSDPAWAGGGDRVQVRLSRRVAGLRLHFVRVPRTARAAAAAPVRAAQAAPAPPIVPRSGWDAKACGPPRSAPYYGRVQMAFVHHTETLNGYSRARAPGVVLGICLFHRDVRGWNDIGYDFLVDRFGTIFEGRAGGVDEPVVGAQAGGWNTESTGISLIGSFTRSPAPPAALRSLAALLRWKLPLEGVPTTGRASVTSGGGPDTRYPRGTTVSLARISGHRDADSTACPGNALYAQLPRLRAMVGDLQPNPFTAPTVLSLHDPGTVQVPAGPVLEGTLTTEAGAPVAGVPLAVEAWRRDRWRAVGAATTGADGAYRAAVAARHSQVLRVTFAGDGSHRRATSEPVGAGVRPALILNGPANAVLPQGSAVTVTGAIGPAKRHVVVTLGRRAGARWRRVGATRVQVRGGLFAAHLRLRGPGLYRAVARFPGDGGNAPAASRPIYLTATG